MEIHAVYDVFLRRFRRARMRAFVAAFRPGPTTTIVDVGGTPYNWRLVGTPGHVTLVNLELPREGVDGLPPNLVCVVGSGTRLEFETGSFDVAFSNSVIEHLGSLPAQQAFAAELSRVGRGLWVQTPARGFPVEPHLLGLFIHWLPRRWQRRLVRWTTGWGWLVRPSPARVEAMLDELRLLDEGEMRRLFPDCEIRRERFLGLTKAYVAVRPGPAAVAWESGGEP